MFISLFYFAHRNKQIESLCNCSLLFAHSSFKSSIRVAAAEAAIVAAVAAAAAAAVVVTAAAVTDVAEAIVAAISSSRGSVVSLGLFHLILFS